MDKINLVVAEIELCQLRHLGERLLNETRIIRLVYSFAGTQFFNIDSLDSVVAQVEDI